MDASTMASHGFTLTGSVWAARLAGADTAGLPDSKAWYFNLDSGSSNFESDKNAVHSLLMCYPSNESPVYW